MDEFIKHIREHLSELDVDVPSAKVWQAIQKEVESKKVFHIHSTVRYAAAACVIFIIGLGVWMAVSKTENHQNVAVQPTKKISIPAIISQKDRAENNPVFVDASKSIASNISQKQIRPSISSTKKQVVTSTTNKMASTDWQMLEGVENSFKQVIHLQKNRINTTPLNAESPSYFKDFSVQIQQMEKDELQIKKEMKQNGFSNELLDQLINIYQQKLILLKQLQSEINKTNNRYKQNRTPVDTTKTYFLNI